MELNELFGLPAHPLLVHAVVVLLPLAAVATVVSAAVPGARKAYAIVAFVLALGSTIFVGLAQGAGESLQERVDETRLVEEHAEQGESVLPWSIGLTIVAAVVVAAELLRDQQPKLNTKGAAAALAVAAIVTGIGSTWTVIDVGHSGAKATWDNLPAGGAGEGGDDDGD